MRTSHLILCLVAAALPAVAAPVDPGKLGARTAPGAGQAALAPLVGRWRVEKSIYVAMGTPDKPALSTGMTSERHWIGDGRFLSDVTTGQIGGKPYFRSGLLGYDPMARRFEWTTADNVTPIQMRYQAAAGSGLRQPIDLAGDFIDPGVLGEADVGRRVTMRTRIRIIDRDHHVMELYFAPPGGPERLADRMVFTRLDR